MKTGADFIFVGSGAVAITTRKAGGIVRVCEGWVRNEGLLTEVSEKRKGYGKCGNPSGSRPNFFGDSTSPLTREASVMAIFEGLLSFCNCCENGSIRCNGRSKLAPLRKAKGIVRFLEGLVRGEGWCGNLSGSRPNFFGRQHLTFDKGR